MWQHIHECKYGDKVHYHKYKYIIYIKFGYFKYINKGTLLWVQDLELCT
jgi:hypothetical protein